MKLIVGMIAVGVALAQAPAATAPPPDRSPRRVRGRRRRVLLRPARRGPREWTTCPGRADSRGAPVFRQLPFDAGQSADYDFNDVIGNQPRVSSMFVAFSSRHRIPSPARVAWRIGICMIAGALRP